MALTFDNVDRTRLTPMMMQLIEQKEKYPDCLIFFRLGDFYELFFDDAITAARELELALTARDCGLDERAPMCGVAAPCRRLISEALAESRLQGRHLRSSRRSCDSKRTRRTRCRARRDSGYANGSRITRRKGISISLLRLPRQ